jgi:hypothetical protein
VQSSARSVVSTYIGECKCGRYSPRHHLLRRPYRPLLRVSTAYHSSKYPPFNGSFSSAMIAAGGAGDILRGSSGKTNAVVFSAVQPHRLGVLKAALNALVAEERILTAPWSLPRWYRPSKRLLRASASGDRASGSRPGVVTPATPPPASERPEGVPRMGQSASLCRCAIYSGSRSGPWVLEAAKSVGVPWPYARFCIWTSEKVPSPNSGK